MQQLFPKTIQKLTQIESLQGAVIVNFNTKEILGYTENSPLDLRSIGGVCANMIKQHSLMINAMQLADVVERILITTKQHYHIIYLVPQFESVAIYVVVQRYIMLPYVTETVESAVYSMH